MIIIHKECKKLLKEEVKKLLDEVNISNYVIDIFSIMSAINLDKLFDSKVKEKLQLYIKEDNVMFTYLYNSILDFILTSSALDDFSSETGFKKLSNYVDTKEFSAQIVDGLESIPSSGCILISLGEDLEPIIDKNIFEVSEELSLIWPDEIFKKDYPLYSGYKRKDMIIHQKNPLMISSEKKWSNNETYLRIKLEGFFGIHMMTEPVEKAINIYKSFLGFMIAFDIVQIANNNYGKNQYYTYSYEESFKIIECKNFDDDMNRILNKLSYKKGLTQVFDKTKFINVIMFISAIMKKRKEAEKLLLSACWLFDSYHGENDLLSFIQTTVALEILLGEKETSDIMGLGALLRNRCAYLLGNSYEERERIIKDFQEIYDIRSKIVHRGKSKLNKDEKKLFRKLQELTKRVIKKEIELLTTK